MGARDKINAISSNVKINKRKSVHIRGYKLPINVQNSMQKDSAQAKISSKVVGDYFFDSPCRAKIITNKRTKFYAKRLSPSENIVKSRMDYFFDSPCRAKIITNYECPPLNYNEIRMSSRLHA